MLHWKEETITIRIMGLSAPITNDRFTIWIFLVTKCLQLQKNKILFMLPLPSFALQFLPISRVSIWAPPFIYFASRKQKGRVKWKVRFQSLPLCIQRLLLGRRFSRCANIKTSRRIWFRSDNLVGLVEHNPKCAKPTNSKKKLAQQISVKMKRVSYPKQKHLSTEHVLEGYQGCPGKVNDVGLLPRENLGFTQALGTCSF